MRRVHEHRSTERTRTCPSALTQGSQARRPSPCCSQPRWRPSRSHGRRRGVGRLRRQGGGLARVARRSEEGAPGDARGERDGDTEEWLDVAQSDSGRIVAVRNKPGRISNFSWFKIWEPDGTSTVEGPLNAPSGWSTYVYPLGFDITADGSHLVYGYSNSSGCCPIHVRSRDVRAAGDHSALDPIDTGGQTAPRSSARGSSRSRTPPPRRSSTSRTRTPATPTRTPSPRGSTPRGWGSTSKASTLRPTGAWRRSGSRRGAAARRRSARSPSSRSRGWIRRPRSPPPWTASCPRPASRGTHRSRRTPARSHGRTTAA